VHKLFKVTKARKCLDKNSHSVKHLITTIELGGAEKQLLTLVREQVNSGLEVIVIPIKGSLDLLVDFTKVGASVDTTIVNKKLFYQIYKQFVGNQNYDGILHAHLPRAELIGSITKGKSKFVISKHNSEPFFPSGNKRISRLLAKVVSRKADAIIAISMAVKEYLVESREIRKKDLEKLTIVHYGVDIPNNFQKKTIDLDNLRFGTMARIVPQKDYPTLLKGFSLINRKYPSTKLLIAGTGYLEKEMRVLSQSLGIDQKIVWMGKIREISEFYAQLDVFLLSSEYEGFGLVLLEAMSHGIPVVAPNNSAIPEVVGDSGGILFDTKNAKSLFQATTKLLEMMSYDDCNINPIRQALKFSARKMESRVRAVYLGE
jgi:glycosyltransferase involved in cell wall biosynthesis